jgi:hypothetical protein
MPIYGGLLVAIPGARSFLSPAPPPTKRGGTFYQALQREVAWERDGYGLEDAKARAESLAARYNPPILAQ